MLTLGVRGPGGVRVGSGGVATGHRGVRARVRVGWQPTGGMAPLRVRPLITRTAGLDFG
eukprot:COSAG04_NODE_24144_length_326_cov_0.907489_1_plen_58_part_01